MGILSNSFSFIHDEDNNEDDVPCRNHRFEPVAFRVCRRPAELLFRYEETLILALESTTRRVDENINGRDFLMGTALATGSLLLVSLTHHSPRPIPSFSRRSANRYLHLSAGWGMRQQSRHYHLR
jgi:hypothetical protein